MLRYRVLTAAVLIPCVFAGLFLTSSAGFAVITAGILLLGAWEWPVMGGFNTLTTRIAYVLATAILLVFFFAIPLGAQSTGYWLALVTVGWLLIFVWIIRYPLSTTAWSNPLILMLLGGFVLIPCWVALNWLRSSSVWQSLLILLLLLVWGADTGAYFVGRWLGKRKLLPAVSPGKTWAGFGGAFVTVVCIAQIAYLVTELFNVWWQPILLGLATLGAAVVGDLAESMFKRNQGIKDSGSLLPGHGGVLDRIDSLTAAAPIFAFVWWLLSHSSSLV